jgi:hypothetical protein
VLTEKQKWKLEVARNTFTHITMVLEETFVEVFKLIERTETRHAGFDAIKKMQAARDEMMTFINALDGVENKKGEVRNMHDSANVQMAHKLAEESTERYLSRVIKSAAPMVIAAGPAPGTREGKPGPKVVGDDPELLDCTSHVRATKETMMQFFARTGLGAHQIRTMSKSEITKFVATVSIHEEVKPPQAGVFGGPAPQRFVLEA